MESPVYQPTNPVRFVTATSLYDGHDVSINIMRRIIQASGAEVIHLGHNRSVSEIVDVAIQEDAQFRYVLRKLHTHKINDMDCYLSSSIPL